MTATVERIAPSSDLGRTVGIVDVGYADTFVTTAPAELSGDAQRAARRFVASAPGFADGLLRVRDAVVGRLWRRAERHCARGVDEAAPVVVGGTLSMFRAYRVDETEVVIGGDERLMRYRILLRLDAETGRFTCATVVERTRNPVSRAYLLLGLPAHVWVVRATMRRFAGS